MPFLSRYSRTRHRELSGFVSICMLCKRCHLLTFYCPLSPLFGFHRVGGIIGFSFTVATSAASSSPSPLRHQHLRHRLFGIIIFGFFEEAKDVEGADSSPTCRGETEAEETIFGAIFGFFGGSIFAIATSASSSSPCMAPPLRHHHLRHRLFGIIIFATKPWLPFDFQFFDFWHQRLIFRVLEVVLSDFGSAINILGVR